MPESARNIVPAVVLLFLWLAVVFCAWLVWKRYSTLDAENEAEMAMLQTRQRQIEELEKLLNMSPCEARKQLESTNSVMPAPVPAAANQDLACCPPAPAQNRTGQAGQHPEAVFTSVERAS